MGRLRRWLQSVSQPFSVPRVAMWVEIIAGVVGVVAIAAAIVGSWDAAWLIGGALVALGLVGAVVSVRSRRLPTKAADQLFGASLVLVGLVGLVVVGALVSWVWPDDDERADDDCCPVSTTTISSIVTTRDSSTTTTSEPPPGCEIDSAEPAVAIDKSFAAPDQATGLAYGDGALWVTTLDSYVHRVPLDPASHEPNVSGLDSTLTPEASPMGITWDGEGAWALTTGAGFEILHFRPEDGIALERVDLTTRDDIGATTDGGDLSWDDGDLWLATGHSAFRLSSTGELLDEVSRFDDIVGVERSGDDLWFLLADSDAFNCLILEVNDPDGGSSRQFPLPLTEASALAWVDDTLWALGITHFDGEPMLHRLDLAAVG